LDIPNLFKEQMSSQILTLLKYGGQLEQVTSSLLWASAKHLHLEAGLTGNLFNIPLLFEACLTESCIKHIWKICQEENI